MGLGCSVCVCVRARVCACTYIQYVYMCIHPSLCLQRICVDWTSGRSNKDQKKLADPVLAKVYTEQKSMTEQE
jgi:hypothetical protein